VQELLAEFAEFAEAPEDIAVHDAEAAEAVHIGADDGDPIIERHLIQVWPAPVEQLKTQSRRGSGWGDRGDAGL
jgi:hypothetical protein